MKSIINLVLAIRSSLNKPADYGFITPVTIGNHIPKVIHQTYHNKTLPTEIQENIAYLKQSNAEWEHRLYDDSDIETYIKKHYPQILYLYQKINPAYGAARADFFRYLVIYNEGGVYLDIKSTVSKPLDDIIQSDDVYLLSYWANKPGQLHQNIGRHLCLNNENGEYQQWHVIATKGHPFLKAVIENICNNIMHYNPFFHDTGGWAVVNMTGPIAYTLAIQPILNQYKYRLAADNSQLHLVYSIYEQKGIGLGHHKILKKHYTVNTNPLVKLNPITQLIFFITNPLILVIKSTLISLRKRY
ncbi:MAG: glycosyltransferase family 32 protein [Methylophilus sp.]|jgi:inositol phosphorylceramide mannosyltransferase catalytic subunit